MKVCPLCGGSGWRPVEKDGLRAVERCECRRPDENWWMDRAMIPARYRQCDFNSFHCTHVLGETKDNLFRALGKARQFSEEYPLRTKGLLFLGNPGVGKTHLAVAILKQLMFQKGIDALFCSYQELFHRIRESYDRDSLRSESEVLGPILNTELLLIDDLGANRFTEWSEDTITYVLNHRYNEKKATILTSNLKDDPEEALEESSSGEIISAYEGPIPPRMKDGYTKQPKPKPKTSSDTLTRRVGLRVRSRLYEMCEVVDIHADDFRQSVLRDHRE